MSYYYKYNFISPQPTFAIVKEELKSYFDSGAVDDLLFPMWTDKCLRKLGKSSFYITSTILHIEDFIARLPDNFYAVREAWLCTSVEGTVYRTPNSFYSQAAGQQTIPVSPVTTDVPPSPSQYSPVPCECIDNFSCNEVVNVVYKTNNELNQTFNKQYLLKPGNISVQGSCSLDCANYGSSAPDSFDIRDNKFVTNFRNGTVYLVFYAKEQDTDGFQMIPDNYRIREYIEAFIKYKVFEQLSNQIVDETFNQINGKKQEYKAMADEAYILAESEIKKQTAYEKMRAITAQRKSLNMYQIQNREYRYGWRRNN